MKVRSLVSLSLVLLSLSLMPYSVQADSVDVASKAWGTTAYASSFSKVEDPRKLLEGEGSWRPLANDSDPRLSLVWPGEVWMEKIVLKGELEEACVSLNAGSGRYGLSAVPVRVERKAGEVVITLTSPGPIRVAEVAFGSTNVKVEAVEVFAGSAALGDALPFRSGELTLLAGDTANLAFPTPQAEESVKGPWLFEAELTASTPFRTTQDYRAIRALALTWNAVQCTVNPCATTGEYSLYRSRPGDSRRELLGSLVIKGAPRWEADKESAGYAQVRMALEGRLLPHLQCGDEQIPFVVFALAAPSFDKLAAYSATGARLWKINTTQSPLLATPDISANVAQCVREIDVNIRQMLALAPQSRIFVAPDLRPRKSWLEHYPEEVFRASDGRGGEGANFGSEVLNRDIRKALRELVMELEKTPYASRIVGILPYFGRGGDGWGYGVDLTVGMPRGKVILGDRSPAEEKAFTRWLEARYGAPLAETLPRHWSEPAMQRALRVPPDAALAGEGDGLLLDPVSQRDVIDYWSYRANSVSGAIVSAGETVKEASGAKLLYGAHYGYVMSARNLAPAFSQLGGHFDLARLLHSDAVDLVNGGSSGDKRGATGNYEPLTPIGSVLLHQKLPVVELDNRSPFTRGVPPYEYYQLYSIGE